VIAIRASIKSGQVPGAEQNLNRFSDLQQTMKNNGDSKLLPQSDDIIDISNDDDDVLENAREASSSSNLLQDSVKSIDSLVKKNPDPELEAQYKEKVVYKPNLVLRKPKMPPPSIPTSRLVETERKEKLLPSKWGSFHSHSRNDNEPTLNCFNGTSKFQQFANNSKF
jgi:hypothetical protein